MSPFTAKVVWSVAQIVVVLCAFAIFLVFAPWLGALPLSDASPVVAAGLPAGCPAFTVNHGQYHCFWHGTRSQNPMGFWLCALLLFSCWAFLIYTSKTKRGFHLPPLRELFHRRPPNL
jgi:magnesium-transporting ATPase (P-type)